MRRQRLKCGLWLLSLLCIFATNPNLSLADNPAVDLHGLKVYKTIHPEKSLLSSPQFIVIDDFNSGKMQTRRGSSWQTKTPAVGALDLSVKKGDSRNPDRGYSLKANFHLNQGEKASLHALLNRLDVSQAEYLVFQCRIETDSAEKFQGRLRVEIEDWRHQSITQDVTASCPSNQEQWGEVILPVDAFSKIDPDQLFAMKFILMAPKEKIRGKLFLDEIAFFGFNDVAFESHRDNLVGFPKVAYDDTRRQELIKTKSAKKMLREIALDTWKYFENARDKNTHLIVDHIRVGDAPLAADYTSPTNIAMDLLSILSARELDFISNEKAAERVRLILKTLSAMRQYDGFFYNFYDTKRLGITRSYISSVDSGWLAIALVVVRQAFDGDIPEKATALLDQFDFGKFLDHENNQLFIGYDVPRIDDPEAFHYGMLVSEARATSLYAIGKGDLPPEHWWFLYRTLPDAWEWQKQKPQGEYVAREEMDYFQGYYEYREQKFVPSWGGSLFEYLMPTLVINEKKLAKKGLGKNDKIAAELHRDYALKEKGYSVWGISPAATSSGRRWKYEELGVPELGAKGYKDRAVITPHVSFLALEVIPKDAVHNIRQLLGFENIYGEYGFFDSINLKTGQTNPQYLALDQGMILVAICNYLTKGAIQDYFHKDPVGQNIEPLLDESFFP